VPQNYTLLTTRQVASQLKVSLQAVRYWIKTGQLPAVKDKPLRDHSEWLIKYKDLNAFIESRMNKAR
jgi:excisionase family DNA binding protein